MDHDLDTRIEQLEATLAPLLEELKRLQRQRKAQLAGQRSAEVRREKKLLRDAQIKAALRAQQDDLYKRNTGGLIKRLSSEFGVSERTVGALYAAIKEELN